MKRLSETLLTAALLTAALCTGAFAQSPDHLVASVSLSDPWEADVGDQVNASIQLVDSGGSAVSSEWDIQVTVDNSATFISTSMTGSSGAGTNTITGTLNSSGVCTVTIKGNQAGVVTITPSGQGLPNSPGSDVTDDFTYLTIQMNPAPSAWISPTAASAGATNVSFVYTFSTAGTSLYADTFVIDNPFTDFAPSVSEVKNQGTGGWTATGADLTNTGTRPTLTGKADWLYNTSTDKLTILTDDSEIDPDKLLKVTFTLNVTKDVGDFDFTATSDNYIDEGVAAGSVSDSGYTVTVAGDTSVDAHASPIAGAAVDLTSVADTLAEKMAVLKFKITDAGGDTFATNIDQIIIPITGTGENASTDIAWAGLYDDASPGSPVATATITNTALTFGSAPDSGGTAGLDAIANSSSVSYTVNVYLNTSLTDDDGDTYAFDIDETRIGVDLGTSSQMVDDSGAVTAVTGTVDIDATQLVFTTQPSTTGTINSDIAQAPVIKAVDTNNNVDTGYISNIAILAVLASNHGTSGGGTLTLTPASGSGMSSGVYTGTQVRYSAVETIDLQVDSGVLPTVYSNSITLSVASNTAVETHSGGAQADRDLSSIANTEGAKMTVLKFEIDDKGGDGIATQVDQITVAVTGSGAAAASDIVWVELYNDTAGSQVMNISHADCSITNSLITFGPVADGGNDADLVSIADGGAVSFSVNIYLNGSGLTATDTQTYIFDVDETRIGVDTGTSSQMGGDTGGVLAVTGTIEVVATAIQISQQPSSIGSVNNDITQKPVFTLIDANSNTDTEFSDNLTITAVLASNNGTDGSGTLSITPASGTAPVNGVFTLTQLSYDVAESIDIKVIDESTSLAAKFTNAITFSTSSTSTVSAHSGGAQADGDLSSIADTEGEKITVLKFAITDAGGDGTATLVDGITVEITGASTGANASADIVWAELYNDTSGSQVATAASITNDLIIFGSAPDSGNDADLVSVADSSSRSFSVNIYLNSDLTDPDNATYVFDVDETRIYTDLGTSSRMASDSSSVTAVTGTITVVATQLRYSTQPSSSGTINVSIAQDPTVSATDENGNVDLDENETITISPVLASNNETPGGGTLTMVPATPAQLSSGTYTSTTLTYDWVEVIDLKLVGSEHAGPFYSDQIDFSATATSTVADATSPQGDRNLTSIGDTQVEKMTVLKFKIVDAGGDSTDTLVDGITVEITGTGGNASADIAWAELYDLTGNSQVATAAEITDDYIAFGINPDAESDADLDTVTDSSSVEYAVNIYLAAPLTGADNTTYVFDIDEDVVFTDTMTSSQMAADSGAVTAVTGTIDVAATALSFTTQPSGTLIMNADIAQHPVVSAVDENNNVDLDDTETVTISAVVAGDRGTAGSGTLTLTPVSGSAMVNGTYTNTQLRYDTLETIDLKVTGSVHTTEIFSNSIIVNPAATTTVDIHSSPQSNFYFSSIDDTEGEKFSIIKFAITDAGDDSTATQIDQISVSIGGSGGNAASDISWAELRASDGGDHQVATSSGINITNSSITFGNAPDAGDDGDMDTVPDGTAVEYTVYIYVNNAGLGATDGTVYNFDIDETNIGTDQGTSSYMAGDSSAVTPVIGTVDVDATEMQFNTQPSTDATINNDIVQHPIIWATDENGNRDYNESENVTITPVDPVSHALLPGALTLAPVSGSAMLSGAYTNTQIMYDQVDEIQLKMVGSTHAGPYYSNSISFTANQTSTVAVADAPQADLDLSSIADTEGEKMSVLKFKITDPGGDSEPTYIDGIGIAITGTSTGENASADIAWAELYNDTDTVQVATAVSILDDGIGFGGLPDSQGDADLVMIPDGQSVSFTVNIYLNTSLTDDDGDTYVFDVNEDGVGTDTGTSSGMAADSGAITPVTGTIDVDVTELRFTQQPSGTGTINTEIAQYPIIQATDENGNLDSGDTQTVTVTAVLSSNNSTPGSGTLTITPASGSALVGGVYTGTALQYSMVETIDLRVVGGVTTTPVYCAAIAFSANATSTVDAAASPQGDRDLASINITELDKMSVLKFKLTDTGGDGVDTLVDQLTVPISGSGANASADITWAELYDDTGSARVATAASINDDSLVFGTAADAESDADLITVSDSGSVSFTVYVYLSASLTDDDGDTYVFDIDETEVDTDTGTGSQMAGDSTAVTAVTGTIDVDSTLLSITTQPSGTVTVATDVAQDMVIKAVDANGNVDQDDTQTVTITPVLASDHGSAGSGTLTLTPVTGSALVNGLYTGTQLQYSAVEDIDVKIEGSTHAGPYYTTTIVVQGNATTTVPAATVPVPSSAISSVADTEGEKFTVIKFKITDAGDDSASTLVDRITVNISGGTASADIAWAELVADDGGDHRVALAASISDSAIVFGSAPDDEADADLDEVTDGSSIGYSVYIYLASTLTAADGTAHVFSLDETDVDTDTNGSSLMAGDSGGVTDVTGTLAVVATQLTFTTQPGSVMTINQDADPNPVIAGTDENGNVDTGDIEIVTITAVNASDHTAAGGNLSLTPVSGTALTAGVYTNTNMTYDTIKQLKLKVVGSILAGPFFSDEIAVSSSRTTTVDVAGSPQTDRALSSVADTEGEKMRVLAFKITDAGDDTYSTHVDRLTVSIGGTGGSASTDIAWAELRADDGGDHRVATAASITDTEIVFGSPPDNGSDSDLDEITEGSAVEYTVYVYMNTSLAATDNTIYTFDLDETMVEPDYAISTQMDTDSGGVSPVTGTVTVVATELRFSTTPSATGMVNVDIAQSPVIGATDSNGNVDADNTETVTISAVLTSDNNMTGTGTLSLTPAMPASLVAGQYINTALSYTYPEEIDLKAEGSLHPGPYYSSGIDFSMEATTTVDAHSSPQADTDLSSIADTEGEKMSVLTFAVTDSGADSTPARVDQITVSISGTGATASADIVWAELYDDTNTTRIATAASISDTDIVFGSTPDSGDDADLVTIPDGAGVEFTVNIYLVASLTDDDGDTYIFDIDETGIGCDTSLSSQMVGDSAAVTPVTGTIDVDATELRFLTQPSATSLVNTDLAQNPEVAATDANGNVDVDGAETLTITTVLAADHGTAGTGSLTLTPVSGSALSAGRYTNTVLTYDYPETIDVKVEGSVHATAIYSSSIAFSTAGTTTVDAVASPQADRDLSSVDDTELEKMSVLKFKITDQGADATPTLLDRIVISVAGTAGNAASDIVWAELYNDTLGARVTDTATLGSISNTSISFGITPDTEDDADLISIADSNSTSFTVNLYFNSTLAASDLTTYIFDVDETLVGPDGGASSQMTTDTTAVTMVAGTIDVDVSALKVTGNGILTAGDSTAMTIFGVDENGNLDMDYAGSKNITFSGPGTIGTSTPTVTDQSASPVNVGSPTGITFTSGQSSAGGSLTVYRMESVNLEASDGINSTGGVPGNFLPLTVTPAGQSALAFSQNPSTGDAAGTPFATQPIVQFQDPYGNVATSAVGNITLSAVLAADHNTAGTGTLGGTVTMAAVAGVAMFSGIYYTKVETIHVKAESGSLDAGFSTDVTVLSTGTAYQAFMTGGPYSLNAGGMATITVEVQDQYGNAETAGAVAITPTSNTAGTHAFYQTGTTTALPGGQLTVGNGSSSGTYDYYAEQTGTDILTATTTLSVTTDTETAIVSAAVAYQAVFTSTPLTLSAGTSGAVTVEVQDEYGNSQSTGSVEVTMSSNGTGTYYFYETGTTTALTADKLTIADGSSSGTFDYHDLKDGTPTITATTTLTVPTDTQGVTVNRDMFGQLQLVLPGEIAAPGTVPGKTGTVSDQTAGNAFSLTVNACDDYFNVDMGITDTVQITSSDPLFTALDVILAAGTKSQSITLRTSGTQTITVTDTTQGGITTDTVTVTVIPGPLHHFKVDHDGTAVANANELMTISARDEFDNVVTSWTGTVTLGTNTILTDDNLTWYQGSGTNAPNNAAGDDDEATLLFDAADNGQVTVYIRGTKFETINISMTDGVKTDDDTEGSLTVGAAGAYTMTLESTTPSELPKPRTAVSMEVLVKDKYGNLQKNAAVTFTVREGDGEIDADQASAGTQASTVTGTDGTATAQWMLGAGKNVARATITPVETGGTTMVEFTVMAQNNVAQSTVSSTSTETQTINLSDGTKLEVPPGAVVSDTTISIEQKYDPVVEDEYEQDVPSPHTDSVYLDYLTTEGEKDLDGGTGVPLTFEMLPSGKLFTEPVLFKIPLPLGTSAELAAKARLYFWDVVEWVPVGGEVELISGQYWLTAALNHFSTYAVVVEETPAPSTAGPLLTGISLSSNPFTPNGDGLNDRLTIRFGLARDSMVSLTIWDTGGNVARTLVEAEDLPAGWLSVQWDGSTRWEGRVSSGNYILEIEALSDNGEQRTETMMIGLVR